MFFVICHKTLLTLPGTMRCNALYSCEVVLDDAALSELWKLSRGLWSERHTKRKNFETDRNESERIGTFMNIEANTEQTGSSQKIQVFAEST